MSTQRTVLIIVAVLTVAGVICYYVYQENNRYTIVNGGAPGVAYEIDKKTGRTWLIRGESKVEQKDPEVEKALEDAMVQQLPSGEWLKISGDAELSSGSAFRGKLYNGSNWAVTRFVIQVKCLEQDSTERWTRRFNVAKIIAPLSTESFSFDVTGHERNPKFEWSIADLYGRPELDFLNKGY